MKKSLPWFSIHRNAFKLLGCAMVIALLTTASSDAQKTIKPKLDKLAQAKGWKVVNRSVSRLKDGDKKGVRFDFQPTTHGVAWLENIEFADGTIEFDVRGKDELFRSFVGIGFHGVDENTYDAIYFRPFNFKHEDPARRLRAVQYISHPEFTWRKLREESPGKYEKPVQPPPDPTGWFHARIVVVYPKISVFVNDASEPSLVVEQLNKRKKGWVGFYVADNSGGDFANLKITPAAK